MIHIERVKEIYSNGEEKESVKVTSRMVKKTDNFFRIYSGVVGVLYGLESSAGIKLCMWAMEHQVINKGYTSFGQSDKEDCMKALNLSKATLYRAIKELEEAGLATLSKARLYINPELAFVGEESARVELLKNKEFEIIINSKESWC